MFVIRPQELHFKCPICLIKWSHHTCNELPTFRMARILILILVSKPEIGRKKFLFSSQSTRLKEGNICSRHKRNRLLITTCFQYNISFNVFASVLLTSTIFDGSTTDVQGQIYWAVLLLSSSSQIQFPWVPAYKMTDQVRRMPEEANFKHKHVYFGLATC